MTLTQAAIHYAQTVDEMMERNVDYLEKHEPDWLQHMAICRLQLLCHTGDATIRKSAKEFLKEFDRAR